MNPLLLIIVFSVAMFGTSYGQKPKGQRSKPVEITKQVDNKIDPLTDSLYPDSFANLYGDSISIIVDSLLKDPVFLNSIDSLLKGSVFLNSLDSADLANPGEFPESGYKNKFQRKFLGWTSDYAQIFSDAQI